MDRREKRKVERLQTKFINKAKQDMLDWVMKLGRQPSGDELAAYKAGYIDGLNRFNNQ